MNLAGSPERGCVRSTSRSRFGVAASLRYCCDWLSAQSRAAPWWGVPGQKTALRPGPPTGVAGPGSVPAVQPMDVNAAFAESLAAEFGEMLVMGKKKNLSSPGQRRELREDGFRSVVVESHQ